MLKDLQSIPLLLRFKVQKSEKFELKISDSKLKSLEKCFSDRTTDKEPLMYSLLKLKTWPMVFWGLPLNKLELTINWFKDVRFPRLEGMESENMFSVRPTCCRCWCPPNQSGIGSINSFLSNPKYLRFWRFNKLLGIWPSIVLKLRSIWDKSLLRLKSQ